MHIEEISTTCAKHRKSISSLKSHIQRTQEAEGERVEACALELATRAVNEHLRRIEESCGPAVAGTVKQIRLAPMAGAAGGPRRAPASVRKAAARANHGGGGMVNWALRVSGLERITDRLTRNSSFGSGPSSDEQKKKQRSRREGVSRIGLQPATPVGRRSCLALSLNSCVAATC